MVEEEWRMLQEKLLKNILPSDISDEQIILQKLYKTLNDFNKKPKYLYASMIQRSLRTNQQQTLAILTNLVNENILNRIYLIRIGDETISKVYQKFIDIPETITVEDSGEELRVSLENHVFVCYEVNYSE